MPNISSSLGTTQRYIPAVTPSQVGRYAGLMMIFTDLTALNAAVADERLNITDTSPIWANGQVMAVAAEFDGGGCVRVWNVAGQHARKVILRPGLSVTLAADSNQVLFAAGAPSAGTGNNGDVSVDWAGNAYYTKSAGAWASSGTLYAAGGGGAVSSVAGKTGAVTLTSADVGLGNVDNTSDVNKPVSTAQQTALNLKANLASPAFTGTPTGITKAHVGLGNVDNTTDAGKPVSTAQQTALNLKADLASPALTGNPTAPTQLAADNSTRVATTAFVKSQPATTLTLSQVTNLAALADDITVEGGTNVTITGRFIPRTGTEAALRALTSVEGELAVASDTNAILLLSTTPGAAKALGVPVLANSPGATPPNNTILARNKTATYDLPAGGTARGNLVLSAVGDALIGGGAAATDFLDTSSNICIGGLSVQIFGTKSVAISPADTEIILQGHRQMILGRSDGLPSYSSRISVGATAEVDWSYIVGQTVGATTAVLEIPQLTSMSAAWGPQSDAAVIRLTVVGKHSTLARYVVYEREFIFIAGVGIVGTIATPVADYEEATLTGASLAVTSPGGVPTVTVTGVASVTMNWRAIVHLKQIGFTAGTT